MARFTEQDEQRLTKLEMQVGALLAGRERMSNRIRELRIYIVNNCPHTHDSPECPTCKFLAEDASS